MSNVKKDALKAASGLNANAKIAAIMLKAIANESRLGCLV